MENQKFEYCELEIKVNVTRRKSGFVVIMEPDGSVTVNASKNTTLDAIETCLRVNKLKLQQESHHAKTNWFGSITWPRLSSGGSVYLFGRRYLLDVDQKHNTFSCSHPATGKLYAPKGKTDKDLLDWLRQQLADKVEKVIEEHAEHLGEVEYRIDKRMVRKWSSKSKSGKLSLSLALYRASEACIEYVILGTLLNRRKLGQVMPNYRVFKGKLKTEMMRPINSYSRKED